MLKGRIRRIDRDINLIVVHATRTPKDVTTPLEMEEWLSKSACDFTDFHYVILKDGTIYVKRDISRPGYHAPGRNADSVGIAYLGGMDERGLPADTRTQEQKLAMKGVLDMLQAIWPEAEIKGAYRFSRTDSPFFKVEQEYKNLLKPTIEL